MRKRIHTGLVDLWIMLIAITETMILIPTPQPTGVTCLAATFTRTPSLSIYP
jgi:hypothetical protein